jgi:hypothetical protein
MISLVDRAKPHSRGIVGALFESADQAALGSHPPPRALLFGSAEFGNLQQIVRPL